LQPSHNLFTDERVFIPRTCVVDGRAGEGMRVRGCHCDWNLFELQMRVLNGLLDGDKEMGEGRVGRIRERIHLRRVQRARESIL
jgi:hypothetical protein